MKALKNSLYVVAAYADDRIVGMGRIVGDGAVICYIQDIIGTFGLPKGGRRKQNNWKI